MTAWYSVEKQVWTGCMVVIPPHDALEKAALRGSEEVGVCRGSVGSGGVMS